MNKIFKRKERGFSLVELMIVVAIIAILAAIAIPAFMKFAMKSKTAEANGNISAIRTCEESHRAENDVYAVCVLSPRDIPDAEPFIWDDKGVDPDPAAGTPGTNFANIGFAPDGDVRYTYAVTVPSANVFVVVATGDLDDDGELAIFTTTKGDPGYPKPIKSGGDF